MPIPVLYCLQEPHVTQRNHLGKKVQLSMSMHFKVKCSEIFHYQWFFDGDDIDERDERYSGINSNTLAIQHFESDYEGTYTCVISTTSQPTVSMSAELKLELEGQQKYNYVKV